MGTKSDAERAEGFIFDRPGNERRIVGALRMCIGAHGPITAEWLPSAAKRVEAVLRSAYKQRLRDLPEPELTRMVDAAE